MKGAVVLCGVLAISIPWGCAHTSPAGSSTASQMTAPTAQTTTADQTAEPSKQKAPAERENKNSKQTQEPTQKPGKQRLTIKLKKGGAILFDGEEVSRKDLGKRLRAAAENFPKETVKGVEVSTMEVVVDVEKGVRWNSFVGVMEACVLAKVHRLYFKHPVLATSEPLKCPLPVKAPLDYSSPPPITLQEVRVKLLWVRKGVAQPTWRDLIREPEQDPEGKLGTVYLKVDRATCGTPGEPDWHKLLERLKIAKSRFRPTRHHKSLPVIIEVSKMVPFKYVIYALNTVLKAGVTNVTFAVPEVPIR